MRWLGTIVAVLVALGAQDALAGTGRDRTGPPGPAPSPRCDADAGALAQVPPVPGAQTITVTVPATTVVRVDRRGRIVEAWTNTGCAPGLADDTWVQLRGREGLEPATAALEARLAAVKWTGAWLPGQWHRPPPEGH